MDDRRPVPDRDLRHLSTDELLALIRQDCRELDDLIAVYRRSTREKKPSKHRSAKEAMESVILPEEADDAPEVVPLHAVTCCDHHMGDFPAWSRVRCPFCNQWHRAGDFPTAS